MTYLTIFSIPKGFSDPHIALIQRNALASWRNLGPDVEVLLVGDDAGVAQAAGEHGATHIPDAQTNDFGTPLLDWAFRAAAGRSTGEILCYVNADIVLLDDFLLAVRRLPAAGHLAIGQRWDCDVRTSLSFSGADAKLRGWARQNGRLDRCTGSDYFVFPRTVDFALPAFAVGRPGWDNWMIGRALELGLPVIDLTPSVTVVHQNHDYGHVAGGGSDWEGPEAERNRRLGGWLDRYVHSPANVTHVLAPGGLRRALAPRYLRARLEAFVALRGVAAPLRRLVAVYRRLERRQASPDAGA